MKTKTIIAMVCIAIMCVSVVSSEPTPTEYPQQMVVGASSASSTGLSYPMAIVFIGGLSIVAIVSFILYGKK